MIYHNIIKAEGFEPKNAKNLGDFDSVGELFLWLSKRGWKPKWHDEPKDSVDFTMKQLQMYTSRLIQNDGTIAQQVEDRRRQIEIANRLEETGELEDRNREEEIMNEIEYEGQDELEAALDEEEMGYALN